MIEELEVWEKVVERFALHSHLGGNKLKRRYQDKFKAELMNSEGRWEHVEPEELRRACLAAGMTDSDAELLSGFLRQRKAGHRFLVRNEYDRAYQYMEREDGSE